MSVLLSIDPALHGVGCALFRDGKLVAAGYVPNAVKVGDVVARCTGAANGVSHWIFERTAWNIRLDVLVVELPQVYSRGANKTKGDPNKCVLPLAMIDSALAALFPGAEVHSYQPHAWKAGTKKPEGADEEYVIRRRVEERLAPEELAAVDWTKSVARSHDVADAIGVGLFHIGRFERKRVYARE